MQVCVASILFCQILPGQRCGDRQPALSLCSPTGEGRISRVIGWHGGTATPCNGSDSIALPAVKMTCGSQGKQRPASSACSMHRDDNKRVPAAYMIAIDLQVCCTMETAGFLHLCRASGAVSMYESQAGTNCQAANVLLSTHGCRVLSYCQVHY